MNWGMRGVATIYAVGLTAEATQVTPIQLTLHPLFCLVILDRHLVSATPQDGRR